MPACPLCSAPVEVDVPFCPSCGTEEPASTRFWFALGNVATRAVVGTIRFLRYARDRVRGREAVVLTIHRQCDGEVRRLDDTRYRDMGAVCDCMRALLFARADGEPEDPDSEQWDCETGALYRVTMRDKRTGRVIYSDDD